MWASLITLVLLGCLLLWFRAWQHGSKLAVGLATGAVLVLLSGPFLRSVVVFDRMPVWVPALPFALIAISLFGFGALAWYLGEDEPRREPNK